MGKVLAIFFIYDIKNDRVGVIADFSPSNRHKGVTQCIMKARI